MPRTIAIGDIHGCSDALTAILRAIDPRPDDTIITLGDYVDRGIESREVLNLLIDLSQQCRLVPILGNHDEIMLQARESRSAFRDWMEFGGITTLDSYGSSGRIRLVPDEHFGFLESCVCSFETETHFFAHANYVPNLALDRHDERTLRWLSLEDQTPGPHISGKTAVLGHTPQANVFDLGHLICIDTGCGLNGMLTALDVGSGRTWQVNTPCK